MGVNERMLGPVGYEIVEGLPSLQKIPFRFLSF